MPRVVIVTGAAGFIGYHVAARYLAAGAEVVGIDNLCDYYDVALKEARLALLRASPGFTFHRTNLADRDATAAIFAAARPDLVVHLAAQPGVRASVTHPYAYDEANVSGLLTVLEGCRHHGVGHLVYASSSSVYGGSALHPSSVQHNVDHPLSLYAATKKAGELMAHAYSHLYRIPTTGLRFFTVYGPWSRPDMAVYGFTNRIVRGEPIDVYNHGQMQRDFTYVDDIVEGVVRVAEQPPVADEGRMGQGDPSRSTAPYRIYNIGNDKPEELMKLIRILERCLGRKAVMRMLPMQPGDVVKTHADVTALRQAVGYQPETTLEDGLARFVAWYRDYHGA